MDAYSISKRQWQLWRGMSKEYYCGLSVPLYVWRFARVCIDCVLHVYIAGITVAWQDILRYTLKTRVFDLSDPETAAVVCTSVNIGQWGEYGH